MLQLVIYLLLHLIRFRYTIIQRYFYLIPKIFLKFFCDTIIFRWFIIWYTFQSIQKFRLSYRTLSSLRLLYRKNENIFLTKRGIYIFFSKFRFFSKEIFVKAFKFLVNFMFICYFFFTAERVWTWFNKTCCFSRLRKNFEYFSPNSHHLHLLLILTPISFSSYICLSFFFFCSLYGCNHKYNLGFVLTLLIYFLMKQFWHVFFWLFLLKSE